MGLAGAFIAGLCSKIMRHSHYCNYGHRCPFLTLFQHYLAPIQYNRPASLLNLFVVARSVLSYSIVYAIQMFFIQVPTAHYTGRHCSTVGI